MPYKSEKIAINNEKLDRRVKLTKEQKVEILELYKTGNYSQRALGRMYNVDKGTIRFIVNPKALEESKKAFAERQKDGRYYDREKNNEYARNHRKYKNELYKQGKIK